MQSLHVLLVDDSLEFLEALAQFLAAQPEITIVGRATSGAMALSQVAALKPDLVLMDLAMPKMNGLEATRRIKMDPGAPCIVIMTLNDTDQYRAAARRSKADGFISKSLMSSQLLPMLARLFPDPPNTDRAGADF
jgi:DNA-binding NarL/FixJ family response regulator